MKYKILGIVICMQMIATVFPAVGSPIQTPMVREYPEKTAATMDGIVISMLEQVDETMYLMYLENLLAFGPRITGTAACNASAEYIYNQFENMGLSVRYHHWEYRGYSSDNVEATINGTDESSDGIYIICAHYDTVGCLGADDDASGTVAVMMAAFIMSQAHYKFNHTIKFVVFSGEEQWMLGSQIYVIEAAEEGWNISGVLNLDMISYAVTTSDGNDITVYENDASRWLYSYTRDINNEYADYIGLKYITDGGYATASDHYYFWMADYDAIYYEESHFNPYWHQSADTIANINATYAVKNIRLSLATLAELAEPSVNNPPATPVLTGPSSGVINQPYTLSVVTTEPDGEDIYYFIEWGDGQVDEWVGPYNSDAVATITHQWAEKGNYTIRAKAKDIFGLESDWATLTVTMPYSYNKPILQFLELLFQRFPHVFPILRQLLGY
jgi:hypothetical protein